MNKKRLNKGGIIYSTDPDFRTDEGRVAETTLEPKAQPLMVWLDSKNRAGKSVTIVTGFVGKAEDLEKLGKSLKSLCGTGGTVKDGEIIIQGDQRDKVMQWLLKNGYSNSKRL